MNDDTSNDNPNPHDRIPDLDPRSAAFSEFTAHIYHAFDGMWAAQPDPLRIFDLWRTGCGHFIVSANGTRGMTVDFIRADLTVRDAPPEPETGQYL